MKNTFLTLEKLGRVRLSQHFYMRQFLFSEIGAAYGLPNLPDFPELAVENGMRLCSEILEPMTKAFGPLVIRSGFRCANLNSFGAAKRLNCAPNERNHAYHIWDHLDADGYRGPPLASLYRGSPTAPVTLKAGLFWRAAFTTHWTIIASPSSLVRVP